MNNKEIQEQRMRGYFIQATKDILKGEGLRGVNVRSIARQAGYSYATLYNYFKDVKDLIFECVKDFLDECAEFVSRETENCTSGMEKIQAISKAYIKYFIQYPGTFELLFIEKMYNLSKKQETIDLITSFFDNLCLPEWNFCLSNGIMKKEDIEFARQNLNYTISGMLLLYLHRANPENYNSFIAIADKQISQILAVCA